MSSEIKVTCDGCKHVLDPNAQDPNARDSSAHVYFQGSSGLDYCQACWKVMIGALEAWTIAKLVGKGKSVI